VDESHVDIARRGYEAIARGDVEAVRDMLAPDVKWHGGDERASGACRSRDQVLEFMRQAHRRGGVGELVEVIDAGERVVVILRPPSTGPGESELRANLTTFRDGLVVEMVAFESPAAALAAARD
jgi:ketosteroid isomerase-like protein